MQSTTTENNTTLTTYIHHQVVTNVTVISLMSQVEVHCVLRLVTICNFFKKFFYNFSHVTIDSESLAELTDEASIVFNVSNSDVINDFGLHLKVGRLGQSGQFNPITGDVTIGEEVRVKLQSIAATNFRLILLIKKSHFHIKLFVLIFMN